MDVSRATQHAGAVAREVVRLGLADQDSVRQLYQNYSLYLKQGVRGTFTQLLLSRGVIDPQGFAQLQANVPPGGLGTSTPAPPLNSSLTSRSSGVMSLGTTPQPPSDRFLQAVPAQAEETSQFSDVMTTPGGPPSPVPDMDAPLELLPNDPPKVNKLSGTIDVLEFDPAGTDGARVADLQISSTADSAAHEGGFEFSDDSEPEPPPSQYLESAEWVDPPKVGDSIGAYDLIGQIGRGGMGVIYKARKAATKEIFALKVLLGAQDAGADRRRQRFRREIEAMRRLEHENVVGVYDYGRKGPFDWYTMDYVDGSDFKKLLEEGELESHEKMKVFEDICVAMSHAHERNVIHRDLKPENVLVDKKGRGHVLDFGLAKILDQGIGMTKTGSALGTPFYMAPEQLKSAKHIDARADVFSLGVILYEISTGVRPFTGETAAEVGNKILTTEPERPTKIKPDLHPDIDAMVIKALEKDPEHRYEDANALYADLHRHRKGFKVAGASGLQGAMGQARRWATANKKALAGVVGGSVITALMLSALMFFVFGGEKEPKRVRRPRPQVADAKTQVEDTKTGQTTEQKTGEPEDPGSGPAKTEAKTEEGPKPTRKTEDPGTRPKPGPSDPQPKPKDPKQPKKARTPIELARLALAPPEEIGTASGARDVTSKNSEEVVRELVFDLEGGLIPAMACGDVDRAQRELRSLKTDTRFRTGAFTTEIEHDIKTINALRFLVGEILKEKPKLLRRVSFYGGGRVRGQVQSLKVTKGGYLRVKLEQGLWTDLDPCALLLETLRAVVVSRDAKVDNSSAHYGLAVVGLWRGLDETNGTLRSDLDSAVRKDGRGAEAAGRRRRLANWLAKARVAAWRKYEDQARDAWLDVEKKRSRAGPCLKALDRFVRDFGRSERFLTRRPRWVELRVQHTKTLSKLLRGKPRGTKAVWSFKNREHAADFEIAPLKVDDKNNPRPFRAESKSTALLLHNARVWLELKDLNSEEGEFNFASNSDGPVVAYLSGMAHQLHRSSWVLKVDGQEKARGKKSGYKLGGAKGKRLSFGFQGKDAERKRVFFYRHPQEKLELPLNAVPKEKRSPRLGIECASDLRLTKIQIEWEKANNTAGAKVLRKKLVERRLLAREAEEGEKQAFLLAKQVPNRLVGFLVKGDWTPARDEMTAGRGASIWATQWAEYGILRFKFSCDAGAGVRLRMASNLEMSGSQGVSWHLPSLMNPSPDRFRQVTCLFNLSARAATVVVDGVRLQTKTEKLPGREAFFGVEFMHATSGKLKDFELVQFRRRRR